ncbi:thioredoxin-like protein [Hesseltinella vesiculosa]|uniref:Thioredoxin-like protein n=1 Tax=Hesseltinella vesiculosa TaxID=101127 RepID=A0A1X2GQP4_9FUNG|nr:thioredoxin-like protein [Hesseltinella vesiculosa]
MRLLSLVLLLVTVVSISCEVIELTDATFDDAIRKQDDWVLEFYADWCGYCTRFRPEYEMIADESRELHGDSPVYFGAINVDKNPGLAARFFIARLPSLFHVHDRNVRPLAMPRMPRDLLQVLKQESWKDIEPYGLWRSPFGPLYWATSWADKQIDAIRGQGITMDVPRRGMLSLAGVAGLPRLGNSL